MGVCGSKLQKENVNLDTDTLVPTYQQPQNNLSRLNLLISNYARKCRILSYNNIPEEIINLCWIYYGKRSTQIFIAGHIFDFEHRTTTKLSLQCNTSFLPSFCYILNIEQFIKIKSRSSQMSKRTFDGILGVAFHENPKFGYYHHSEYHLVLLVFECSGYGYNCGQTRKECIQVELKLKHSETIQKFISLDKYSNPFLYCGKYGIFTPKGTICFPDNCVINIDGQERNQISVDFRGIKCNHYCHTSWCYLHNRKLIFLFFAPPRSVYYRFKNEVALFDLETEKSIFKQTFAVSCNKCHQDYKSGENFCVLKLNHANVFSDPYGYDIQLGGLHASCYDGNKYVYIVSNDGFVLRFDLDLKILETIHAAKDGSDLYMQNHRVWMENESSLYCTDGHYWMYMNINDNDRRWISINVDMGVDVSQGIRRKMLFI